MGKLEKLIKKIGSKPKDFTYGELKTLLRGLGYEEFNKGKTSGSRVAFVHSVDQHIVRLHKPHPGNILKRYQVDAIFDELKRKGRIS